MSNRKLVSFRLPDDLMHDLREKADHESISVTELVCRLLRQGLHKTDEVDERVVTLVDERIEPLSNQIKELIHTKQVSYPAPPTPLYALLTPSTASQNSLSDTDARLERLERLMERLINSSNSSHASSPHESS